MTCGDAAKDVDILLAEVGSVEEGLTIQVRACKAAVAEAVFLVHTDDSVSRRRGCTLAAPDAWIPSRDIAVQSAKKKCSVLPSAATKSVELALEIVSVGVPAGRNQAGGSD